MTFTLILFITVAVVFDFMNGFNDSANIVSTMISSRALSPRQALTITAIAEFIGPFLFGVAVAKTIGAGVLILPSDATTALPLILSSLVAAVCWNVLTWHSGIPSSSSHALIGGLLGAAVSHSAIVHCAKGIVTLQDFYRIFEVVQVAGLLKILTSLLISPAIGFIAGFFLLKLWRFLARGSSPSINKFFRRSQVVTAIGLALSHGTNDAQKTMGIITMGLLASGQINKFEVPMWVVALSASAIALGTSVGGWRLIRTLGSGFFRIRPIDGFSTQIGSGLVIICASLLGGPVSTTQVVSTAIMGVGSADRLSKVRWGVSRQIIITWIITIPCTSILAGLIYLALRQTL
ncbi:inorganic phosphate transporter [Bdellovibrionota bacterium FG-2]